MLRWRRLCIVAAEQSVADEDAAEGAAEEAVALAWEVFLENTRTGQCETNSATHHHAAATATRVRVEALRPIPCCVLRGKNASVPVSPTMALQGGPLAARARRVEENNGCH